MTSKALRRYALPLVVFPAFTAVAVKFLFGRLRTGIADGLHVQCTAPDSPCAISFTGNPQIDPRLCGVIALFHNVLDSPVGLQLLFYGLGTGSILWLFPFLEASRSRKPLLLAFPMLWLLLGQVVTVGLTMTIYTLIFILSGSHLTKRKKNDTTISRAEAESLIFSLIVGYVVPSLGMVYLKDPQVTAIWQIFPIIMSMAAGIHLLIRRILKAEGSGWPATQILLLGVFMISSSVHFATVVPLLNDKDALKAMFIPALAPLPPSSPMADLVLDFLQWDFILALSSLGIATLWFANNLTQFIGLIVWYAFAVPMAGPGAALTGALLWREAKLQ